MGDSYSESANVARDLIRLVFSFLDRPAYWLLGIVYQLFFNVASADLFSNNTIMKFYGRVQMILGVFMMFQLAMTILRGIIEPDSFTKDKGAGSLIRRVVIALILITILMPINIPSPRNEYEKQLNNNGLLFGTLYSLQHRILANNTIGRLVLGTNDSNTTYISDPDDTELKKSSRIFTSTILKGFYRINLVPEDQRVDTGTKDPATANENRMCKNIDRDMLEAYTRLDAEPGEIIGMVNETCTVDFNLLNYLPVVNAFAGSKKYVFTYMPFISMIVAIVFVFILLSFTIDVAVRAVKLAVLRLIAPIPIIAYMDPKGTGDETFKSWTKTLVSTYIDLFIRLAVVYFVIFLIQDMIVNGVVINYGKGVIGILSLIIIWIGLFIFAKQAPKFIKQVLGLKSDMGKLFSGFGELAAAGTVAAGAVSGAVSKGSASYGKDHNPGKAILMGMGGFLGGGYNAGKGYFGSEKPDAKGNMAKVREYNARNYSNAADDSTFGGRLKAGFQGAVGRQTDVEKMDKKIAAYQRAEGSWKSVQNALDSDGWKKDGDITGHEARGGYVHGTYDSNDHRTSGPVNNIEVGATGGPGTGKVVLTSSDGIYSLKDLKDAYARMQSSGQYSATELQEMETIVKIAERRRYDFIRKSGGSDLETPRERQVYEGLSQIVGAGRTYAKDEDGVFSDFDGNWSSVEEALNDDAAFGGKKMASVVKGAAYAAGAEATQIKSSNKYAQAAANAKRASEAKKK